MGNRDLTTRRWRRSGWRGSTDNARVWNGLYFSRDRGASWRATSFEGTTPAAGLAGVTDSELGQQPGLALRLTRESDPALAFDRDGNLYRA